MTFQPFDPSARRYDPAVATPPPPTPAERTWGAVAHGGSFVAAWLALGVLCPIAVIVAKGSTSAFVRHHAYESLNFQLNTYLWIIAVSVFGIVTFSIGWVAFVPLVIWYAIFVVVGTVAANNGDWYRYPLIIRFFRP